MTLLGLRILKFIKKYVKTNEIPPTRKEMIEVLSASADGLNYAINRLEEDQLIKRVPGRSRNIWPV